MSIRESELRFEGVVRAHRYNPEGRGKQFLGAVIERGDGKEWVISYDEQSPYHPFADRQVVVSGETYKPEGQQIGGGKIAGHFRVSTMRLVRPTADAQLVEVGAGQHLRGRLERDTSDIEGSTLSFVTEKGETFSVANDPAGATVGSSVEVWAYPVQRSLTFPGYAEQCLWVICPCSVANLWEWRARQS